MIIKCQTKKQTDILKEAVHDKLENDYEVAITRIRKPKIRITNFDQDLIGEELERIIKEQNNIIDDI